MTLKARISLIAILTTLIVAAVLGTVAQTIESLTERQVADAVLDGNRLLWNERVKAQLELTRTAISAFDDEFELRAAIKRNDASEIAHYADRYVQLTGDQGQYDLLQVFGVAGERLYSSAPELRIPAIGQLLDRVKKDRQIVDGILGSNDGHPLLVVAFPVESRNKLKGMAVYARRLEKLIPHMATLTEAGVGLYATRLIASTDFPTLDDLKARVSDLSGATVWTDAAADRRYVVSAEPMLDASGKTLAYLLVARDDTDALTGMRQAHVIGNTVAALTTLAGIAVLVWMLTRYLAPLRDTAARLSQVAGGDLTGQAPEDGVAEVQALQKGMNHMAGGLRGMVSDIAIASDEIRQASGSIRHCVSEANANVADQNSRSERISLSLSDMAHSVQSAAEVTEQAAKTALDMGAAASEGHTLLKQNVTSARELSDEIGQVSDTIESLNDQAEQVTRIIEVIKGIAEQTNLLALNAAIEAARAGEQGRGFSVVADEVRALASRTQQSTAEIEQIIDDLLNGTTDSVDRMSAVREHVGENMTKANSALACFDGIKAGIDDLAGINQVIATAVEQQRAVSREVADNMAEIQQLATANTRRTEYLTGTTDDLHGLAERLTRITGQFRYTSDQEQVSVSIDRE